MKILAIDPGPTESAYVLLDGERICLKGKEPNEAMRDITFALCDADIVAIEKIASYGMAVGAEVFETCVWTGRFIERMTIRDPILTRLRRIPRGDVKMHLCKSMRAKDGNIRQALIDRLGAPGTKKSPGATYGVSADIWAALAVGITALDKERGL